MIAVHAPLTASTQTAHPGLDFTRLRVALAATSHHAIDWLVRTLCGLRGHAMMLHFESARLSLHCANCGQTTPGWAIQTSKA